MKTFLQLFLWTCTALFLGLLTILAMSAIKGNINRTTVTQVVALLNGIDIQGERIRLAMEQAKSTADGEGEVGSDVAINPGDTRLTLETDLRSASLDRFKKELDERAARLKEATDRHEALVAEFKKEMDKAQKEAEDASLQKVADILQVLEPVLAKEQVVTMLTNGRQEDVLAIIDLMDADKLKKILGEFTDIADQERITEILDEIRARGKRLTSGPTTP